MQNLQSVSLHINEEKQTERKQESAKEQNKCENKHQAKFKWL